MMISRLLTLMCLLLAITACTDTNNLKTNEMAGSDTTTQHTTNKPGSFSGYAPANGLSMYYEIYGDGEPLVLIHGGGSTIQTSFGNMMPLLADHYKLIAVELQAHGHTKDRGEPSSFEQDADDVAALLQYLKISKAHVLGFSNGGSTGLQLAIRHPELVNKLVAISAIYKRNGMIPGFFDGMKNARLSNMPQPLQDAYMKITGDTNGLQIMHDRDKNRMLAFKDWPETDLRSIQAPVLLISSDKDVILPQHTVEMSQKIQHATLTILPGVHGELIGEVCTAVPGSKLPAITATLIRDFLDAATNQINK